MIRIDDNTVELNGDIDEILGQFVVIGMTIKEKLNELEDGDKVVVLNEFQADLIRMYKYNSCKEFMEADAMNTDINIRELFGLED